MVDVFLSYKRSERAEVELIADRLRKVGLTVWFDANLSSGGLFHTEINREARNAHAILVCWSPDAAVSKWVAAEAMIGFNQNKLAACLVAGEGQFEPPTPFNLIHAEDLRSWVNAPNSADPAWMKLLHRIGKLCSRPDIEAWGGLAERARAKELRDWLSIYRESPLFYEVHQALELREAKEAEEAQHEEAARLRRREEQAQRELEAAEEKRARELLAAEAEEQERRARGPIPTFIGTLLAVPIFFGAYAAAASLAYVGLIAFQWLMESKTGGLTNGAELIAALGSGYAGVAAGRTALDSLLRAWNGWPTFILLIAAAGLSFSSLAWHRETAGNVWLMILLGGHTAVALFFALELIVRKKALR